MVAPNWRKTKCRHRQETPVIMNTRRDVDRRVDRRIYWVFIACTNLNLITFPSLHFTSLPLSKNVFKKLHFKVHQIAAKGMCGWGTFVRGHISTVMVVSEGEGGAIKKYLRCRSSGASIEGRKVPTARDIILLFHAQKRKATLQVVLPAGSIQGWNDWIPL